MEKALVYQSLYVKIWAAEKVWIVEFSPLAEEITFTLPRVGNDFTVILGGIS